MSHLISPTPLIQKIKAKKWLLLIGVVVLVGIGSLIYHQLSKNNQSPQYQTAQAEKGTLVVALTAAGQVESTNSKEVDTQASGVVTKVYVKEGQKVKAGAVIAKIELDLLGKQKAQQALASYQSAKNQLAAAQNELYSLQSKEFVANQTFMNGAVVNNNVASDPNYIIQQANWLGAEAAYKNQQAVINQSQLAVSQSWLSYQQTSDTIYAPISGTITGLNLQAGSVIQGSSTGTSGSTTGTKIANIVTEARPTIKLSLTQIDIPKVKVGDKATVTFDAFKDKTFVGQVLSIDTVGATSSNVTSYPVIIQLNDQTVDILPNMGATANIIIDSKTDVVVVPNSAVQTQNGATTVRVMEANDQIKNVPVTVGLVSDIQSEILTGLSEGQTVVTAVTQAKTTSTTATGTSPFSALSGGRGSGGAAGGATFRSGTTGR